MRKVLVLKTVDLPIHIDSKSKTLNPLPVDPKCFNCQNSSSNITQHIIEKSPKTSQLKQHLDNFTQEKESIEYIFRSFAAALSTKSSTFKQNNKASSNKKFHLNEGTHTNEDIFGYGSQLQKQPRKIKSASNRRYTTIFDFETQSKNHIINSSNQDFFPQKMSHRRSRDKTTISDSCGFFVESNDKIRNMMSKKIKNKVQFLKRMNPELGQKQEQADQLGTARNINLFRFDRLYDHCKKQMSKDHKPSQTTHRSQRDQSQLIQKKMFNKEIKTLRQSLVIRKTVHSIVTSTLGLGVVGNTKQITQESPLAKKSSKPFVYKQKSAKEKNLSQNILKELFGTGDAIVGWENALKSEVFQQS